MTPVDAIRDAYLARDDFWGYALVDFLDPAGPRAALDWAADAAEHLAAAEANEADSVLPVTLAALRGESIPARADEFLALAARLEDLADPLALALAHLLVAEVADAAGDRKRYRHHVAKGVLFLGRSPYYRASEMAYPLGRLPSRAAERAGKAGAPDRVRA